MWRWPKLVERKPQHLPANHATALTEGAINAWIMKVKAMINEAVLGDLTTEELAQRMWNSNETAFATDVASKRVLARKDPWNRWWIRQRIHNCSCMVVDQQVGSVFHPMSYTKGRICGPPGLRGGQSDRYFNVSESGWMEQPHFLQWYKKLFLPAASSTLETGPVILFMDGHASHINLELIRLARDHGVFLFCLPSHTTHALQPLDVGVYGPLKSRWEKILKEYKMEMCSSCRKKEFPCLLKRLWEKLFEAIRLKAGFRKAGLCPLTTEAIAKSSFPPSIPHTLPPPESQSPKKVTTTQGMIHSPDSHAG